MLETVLASILFSLETFHATGHAMVLFRVRLLPRRDIIRIRYYFLLEGVTSFAYSLLYTGNMRWLALLHSAQHVYHVIFWDLASTNKRVVNWSSLDWLKSNFRERWQLDAVLSTVYDISVHLCLAYYESQYLSWAQLLCSLGLAELSLLIVMYGPYYAWSSPSQIPPWVRKRIAPLATN